MAKAEIATARQKTLRSIARSALALGDDGTLYIADSGNHKIRALLPGNTVITVAGRGAPGYADGAASSSAFHAPEGVAVLGETLYVADTLNHRVRAIRNGLVTTIAGSGQPARIDGVGVQASFHEPAGLAALDADTLVVADRLNHQLRSAGANGAVVTVAGTGHPGYVDTQQPAQAQFAFPDAVAVAGLVVIADSRNAAVRLVYPNIDLTEIEPNAGPVAGGNEIKIVGSGFAAGRTSVRFGSVAADAVRYESSTELAVTVPEATAPGAIDIVVETPAGTGVLQDGYTYFAPPTIGSVDPHKGAIVGGEVVTIYGSELALAATEVFFGDDEASDVSVHSANSLTATTPEHGAGTVDVKFTTPGGTATAGNAFTYFAPPIIHSFTPAAGRIGSTVILAGANFDDDAGGSAVRFGDVPATVVSASSSELVVAVPANAITAPIFVATAGGMVSTSVNYQVLAYTQLAVTPASITLDIAETATLTAMATLSDQSTETLSSGVTWETSNASVASVDPSGVVQAVAPGTATITATFEAFTATATVSVQSQEPLPPDPVTIAPPLDTTVATSFANSIRFLYTNDPPVQQDVVAGAIVDERAAVIRGTVTDRDLRPLAGVRVEIAGAPHLGWTLTRADGAYDIAVNGGGAVTVVFRRNGYLSAQRQLTARWNAFVVADPVALVAFDSAVTTITPGATTMQVARGNTVTDSDGDRTATILFPAGTTASMILPDGTSAPLPTLNVRATEYSVGPQGPSAMPAALPPHIGYTYCVELTVDEALAAGADRVQFSSPVVFYVDNFLEFPVGTPVPVGYYDRKRAVWVPSDSGKVVKVVAVNGAQAEIDLDGNGLPESAAVLEQNGITTDERGRLAALYTPGQSLWRATIDHFTPIDLNWPMLPSGAVPPGAGTGPQGDINPDDVCTVGGSVIECQSQVLGESIPITGTGLTLEYRSSRVPGRRAARNVDVVMTTAYVPDSVKEVKLTLTVAGKRVERSFAPSANIRTSFLWNGLDAYGRPVQGAQPVDAKITYVYPADFTVGVRFGIYPDGVTLNPARTDFAWSRERTITLRPWDARSTGLGGWTLSEHRALDKGGNVAYNGDGTKRSGDDVAGAISTIAGNGVCTSNCRYPNAFAPIPATQATLFGPRGVAAGPDGATYIIANNTVLRLVGTGIIKIAGNGSNDWYGRGDGGPALQAGLWSAHGIALAPDGTIYLSEPERARIRRITPDGIITLFAGGNEPGYSGDGGPAVSAQLTWPTGIAVASDGSVYISEHTVGRVRRVTPDGWISTVAGGGTAGITDGARARSVALDSYPEIAAASDGSIYIAGRAVWRLDSDGRLRSVAGPVCGTPGTPACKPLSNPAAVSIAAGYGGEVYVGELASFQLAGVYQSLFIVRRIDGDGTVTVVAQGLTGDPYIGYPPQHIYFSGEGAQATAAGYGNPKGLAVAPDGGLVIADTGNLRVRRISTALGKRVGVETFVASGNGDISVFDAEGRHRRTIDPLTGAVRASFSYDTSGRLAGISDAVGNVTAIERNADGSIAIVAPSGERTLLGVDGNGYLASIANPAGETTRLSTSADGLLGSLTRPSGVSYSFQYNELGRLGTDSDPAGGSKNLSLTRQGLDYTLTLRTGMGRETTYQHQTLIGGQLRKTLITAGGAQSITDVERSLRTVHTSADGTVTTMETSPDPRFGMELPFVSKATLKTPSGRTLSVTASRSVTGLQANNPLSFATLTESRTINGKTYTTIYDAASRRITSRTPAGRTVTMNVDALGRVSSVTEPGNGAFSFGYDPSGELASVSHGERTHTFTYDDQLRMTAAADPMGATASFTYAVDGRLASLTLHGGRTTTLSHDANGNIISVTPPGREAHEFGHTGVNLVKSHSYGGTTTLYTSNGDRQLTQIDVGGELISLFYEPGGRLDSIVGGGTAMTYTYGPSGLLLRAAAPGGTVEYSRDGFLLTRESLTGEIAATVDYTYNADLRLGAESLRGISVAYGYDADGFITTAGTMSLTRRTDNGAVASTTLASTRTEYIYSATGDLQSLAASHSGTALLSFNYTRDAADRITSTGDTDYDFDDAGRLIRVLRGGTAIAEYDYDENGNRTAHRWLGGSASATYDDQDRLVEYGGTSYRYDQNGTLEAKITGGETSTFDYDALGNLRNASLPGGTRIDYLIDGQNRRVGKKIDGILMQGWIYAGQLRVIAEVDGTGAVISRFIYGTRSIVPDYMVKDGMTYRIVSDHLGSPRLVINASTGAIAQRLDYDAYGVVISDSAPGFQPFGFAGGLYDRDTRLVRFGARDYDPSVGRWTSKEPFLFAGGETNPYAYGFGDPVNYADYSGLAPVNPEVAFAVGGALVGVAGQAFGDIIAGEVSPWEDYVGSAVGGAVTALVLKNAGPVPAGLIGGAAGSFVRQSLKVMTGKQCAFNWVDFGTEVTIGGIGGKIFGTAAKAGITLGRNSMAKIYKEYMTKIANGTVNYISPKTAAKMFVGRATDAGFFSGTAGGAAMSLGVSNVWDSPDPNCGCR